ncbi:hypothetical protein RJ640_006706 [Escallonia rubra]|uniref:BZIP domain-containing protein n=1 Tax=Escallonia rubra TaxID=112253 RepID=A0AA88UKG4_9ASTE|nr:hypothetical protein RJ640_006706 [Escallonia rubra]
MVSPNKFQGPNIPLLVGQGAIQNLSLDEVIQNPSSSSSSSSPPLFRGNITFHGKLGKKTMDEVWEHVNAADGHDPSVQPQPTLGETTLEDFLVRRENQNGFVTPQPVLENNPMVVVRQVPEFLQLQMRDTHQTVVESNFQVSQFCFENHVMENNGYSDNQWALPILPVQAVAATASSAISEVGVERKRQFHDGTMEKTIEKRQRRMIKNRESAARSRARKQVIIYSLSVCLKATSFSMSGLHQPVGARSVPVTGNKQLAQKAKGSGEDFLLASSFHAKIPTATYQFSCILAFVLILTPDSFI